jgi:hypothetical protein
MDAFSGPSVIKGKAQTHKENKVIRLLHIRQNKEIMLEIMTASVL